MSLAPGARIGSYEVLGLLGAGGMGEVYRARDTKLARDVALKILPEAFSDDPDRRARFEREAQAVAALSHPNIVGIFDTGLQPPADGAGAASKPLLYVVMELLSGHTLRERLTAGPIPVRKAVEIAIQIARGLGAAHSKGVVHRDLKPENVFLLDDGQVKILDFGLARQVAAPDHSGATQTIAATDPGTVMGTVGYMAPEQVRGQAVDARADVFAFGVVLYEMISGVPAFKRETAADTMTAILTQDPPELTGSRPDFPASLDRIIRHCLEKNPNERFQSARDIAFALEALSGSSQSAASTSGSVVAVPGPAVRRGVSPVVVAALVVAALAGGVLASRALRTTPAASLKFTMKTFESQSIFNGRFMPDGETIVFSAARTGNIPDLFEIRAGTLEARQFGPPDTHLLSVSSKGELAILTNAVYRNHRVFAGTLARMTIEGAPKPWLEDVREADWSPDGTTLAIIRDVNGRDALEYPIGTKLYEAGGYLSDPRVSPDGKRVAFMEHPARFDDRGFVKVVDASRTVTTLAGEFWGEQGVAWSRDGSSIFFAGNVIASDDKERGAGAMSYQIYQVAANGKTPAAFALTSPGDFTIYDMTANGQWLASRDDIRYGVVARGAGQAEEHDLSWLNKSWSPVLSPDGQRLMFSDGNAGSEYAVVWRKIDGSPIAQLGAGEVAAGWSPDGKWALGMIASTSKLVAYPIGAGEPRPINTDPVTNVVYAMWMPDSQSMVIFGNEPGKSPRHYRLPLSGGSPVPILPENLALAMLAPNGEIALGETPDNAFAIYPLAGGPGRPITSLGATDEPVAFSEDSRTIFVQQVGNKVPAVVDRIDVATGKRTPFKEFAPADRAGLTRIYVTGPVIKSDGTQYAYGYVRRPSVLFVVNGAAR